jgi:hypothetical protein
LGRQVSILAVRDKQGESIDTWTRSWQANILKFSYELLMIISQTPREREERERERKERGERERVRRERGERE